VGRGKRGGDCAVRVDFSLQAQGIPVLVTLPCVGGGTVPGENRPLCFARPHRERWEMEGRSQPVLADGQGMFGDRVHLREGLGVGRLIPYRPLNELVLVTSAGKLFLILTTTTIILFIRKTDSILNPQFWAEDGVIFFLQQYEQGASAIFQPYAGYLHLVPRLIAFFADLFFPYSFAPYVYNYSSLLITLLVIASIYSRRFTIGNKNLLSLTIVLIPHYTSEVFLNITNLQWILAILIIITLLKEPPHPKYGNVYLQIVSDLTVIICCGLTGPFIIFLTPFFMWKYFNNKSRYSFIIVLVVIAVASMQTLFIINSPPLALGGEKVNQESGSYAKVIGQKLFGNLFLGISVPYQISPSILCILLLFIIFFISDLSIDSGNKRASLIFVFLSFSFAVVLATLYRFKANLQLLIPPGNGPRYFYLPYIMMVWSLIVCVEQKEAWKSTIVKVLLCAALISSLTSGFHSGAFIDYEWKLHSRLIGKKQNLVIPINPEGWQVRISQKGNQ
jgi:hypothetical protein